MSWNYRVIKRKTPNGTDMFDVQEVYYGEDGKPEAWSEDQRVLLHETLEELTDAFLKIQVAMHKPVLEVSEDGKTLRELI